MLYEKRQDLLLIDPLKEQQIGKTLGELPLTEPLLNDRAVDVLTIFRGYWKERVELKREKARQTNSHIAGLTETLISEMIVVLAETVKSYFSTWQIINHEGLQGSLTGFVHCIKPRFVFLDNEHVHICDIQRKQIIILFLGIYDPIKILIKDVLLRGCATDKEKANAKKG